MKYRDFLFIFLMLFLSGEAYAHGFVVYVSTPLTSPQGFVWVSIAFVVVFCAMNFLIWRKLRIGGRRRAVLDPLVTLLVFAPVYLFLVNVFINVLSSPTIYMALPHRVYWGWAWHPWAIIGFLVWNGIAFGILMLILYFGGRFRREPKMRRWRLVLKANAIAYVIFLIPYAATGALTYGWAGFYANRHCYKRMEELNAAIIRYSEDHDWRLPSAESFDELLPRITPYVRRGGIRGDDEVFVCPVEASFCRTPRPYIWNREMSG